MLEHQKLYVVVRSDLSPGLATAQAVHAAIGLSVMYKEIVKNWDLKSQYLVILECDDIGELIQSYRKRDSVYAAWFEPDLGNELTAVAFRPGPIAAKVCSNLPLLGRAQTPA